VEITTKICEGGLAGRSQAILAPGGLEAKIAKIADAAQLQRSTTSNDQTTKRAQQINIVARDVF
jgi:hypothetical protein